jgi:gluconate 5-dehydrogenase
VIINGTRPEVVSEQVEKLKQAGGKSVGYIFDITDSEQVDQQVKLIESEVGAIDILINNAGIQRRGSLEELSVADWKQVIEVDLNAAFIVAKSILPGMIKRRKGKIINITSLMAEGARPSTGNYCAAKGGLKMLTKAMATEWGQYNIQANAIGPGYFVTDLTQSLVEDPKSDSWVKQKVPLGRWGTPSELVGTAIFLSSQASDYVNGQTIYVDGGWLAAL